MTRSWIPDPIPTPDGMDDQGYEAWVWAAGHRPRWLATLNDPHSYFRDLADRINREKERRACEMLGIDSPPPEEWEPTPAWDEFVSALIRIEPRVMAELAYQDPETTEPVWVEGEDDFDPDAPTSDAIDRWWERVEDTETLDEVSWMVEDLDPKAAAATLAQRWPEIEDLDSEA